MQFDISGVPPSADEITYEREQLEARLRLVTRWGWTVITALGVLAAGLASAWWWGGMTYGLLGVLAIIVAVTAVFAAAGSGITIIVIGIVSMGLMIATMGGAINYSVYEACGCAIVGVCVVAAVCDRWESTRYRYRARISALESAPRKGALEHRRVV